ncbi:MAG TPA: mycothiol system anti-sigma-R factor [Acidimicrobiales bacterium]|jgi:mycothiol system anti-sigma-R factor|nr:mycothiol system anti-sigma-R factor [Acidimicrobiales bacterium]
MASQDPNCSEAIHTLYEFLDGELTTGRKAEIQQHLEACLPCFQAYDFEAELRLMIGRKCQDQAPAALQQRVSDALRRISQPGGGIPNL